MAEPDFMAAPRTLHHLERRIAFLRAKPEKQRRTAFEDLLMDTMVGIAHGAEDPQTLARTLLSIGPEVYDGEVDMWITWEPTPESEDE